MAVNYSHTSSRAIKARLARRLDGKIHIAENSALGIVAAATIYLLITQHHLGWSLLGVDLLASMLIIWQRWDLESLDATSQALTAEPVRLDQALEPRLLAVLHPSVDTATLWGLAAAQWEGIFILNRLGVPSGVVTDVLKQQAIPVDTLWQAVVSQAQDMQAKDIDAGIVVAATLLEVPGLQPVLSHLKLTPEEVMSVLFWEQRFKQMQHNLRHKPYFGGIARDWAKGYTPLLDQFATNISFEVEAGAYRSMPHLHQDIIEELVNSVSQNRPAVLVGEIGSGRTSLVYALAQRILQADRVPGLAYYQVMSLNATMLISSGAKIEDAVMNLLAESIHAKNTILYLDEANLFLSNGPGAVDLSHILLPILQRNNIKLILSMSNHDWQQLSVAQPAFVATLQRLVVNEPSNHEAQEVLQDEALFIEHQSKAIVTQLAINEAIKLSTRYMPELALPGKAISVLESAAQYPESGFITAGSVQQAISVTTGAKVTAASAPEKQQLLQLEEQIHRRMINQTRAVSVVADALRRSRAGVGSPKRPVGSFLFLGPTGVGKTELAKSLAAVYFGGEHFMIRLDMSEYQQQSDVARLLAASSGAQTGGTLVSRVRQSPSSVVLLDEIEKAHPDVLNLLLQMLDEGQITDSDGRVVSFKDAIIIATSNAAADEIRAHIAAGEAVEQFEDEITEHLIGSHQFKPELLNRFDEIVIFRPLTKDELTQVVGLMMAEVNATLKDQNVSVALTPAAAGWLVAHGYNPALGARPLRRMVQRTVENVVAQRLLSGAVGAGQTVTLDVPDLESAGPTGV